MPGTPDPVLGSDAFTWVVAGLVGAAVAATPYLVRDRLPAPGRLAIGGGVAYAALCLAVWAGVRAVADAFLSAFLERPSLLVLWLALAGAVLALQAAVPLYLLARKGMVLLLVGLFVATTVTLALFLQVGGETDALVIYPLVFGPALVAATWVAALPEAGLGFFVATAGRVN